MQFYVLYCVLAWSLMPEITYIDDKNILQIVHIRDEAVEYIVHIMST